MRACLMKFSCRLSRLSRRNESIEKSKCLLHSRHHHSREWGLTSSDQVCAAFIFAAQTINFPIPGGTSGHLLGGTLAGVLLGPWAGSLVMAVVFIVQSAIFQDGGLTALGANITNMGLMGTFGGYYLYRSIRFVIGRNQLPGMVAGVSIAAWFSVMVAATVCSLELQTSGTVPLAVALPAMVSWHALIGVGEALITVVTVSFIWRSRPDLFYDPPRIPPRSPDGNQENQYS